MGAVVLVFSASIADFSAASGSNAEGRAGGGKIAYAVVSRIAVTVMAISKTIQFLRPTCFEQLLQERKDGKTLAQLEPVPQMGKKLITVPAELLNELNESKFSETAFVSTEKSVETI